MDLARLNRWMIAGLLAISLPSHALPLTCQTTPNAPVSQASCQRFADTYAKRLHHIEYYCQQRQYRKQCSKLIAKPYGKFLSQSMQDAFTLTKRMTEIEQHWSSQDWQAVIAPGWQAAEPESKQALKIAHDRNEYQLSIKALQAIDTSLQAFGLQVGLLVAPQYSGLVKKSRARRLQAQTQLRKVLQGCASNAQISAQCYYLNLPSKAEYLDDKIAKLTTRLVEVIPQQAKVTTLSRQQRQSARQLADIVETVGLLNERASLLVQASVSSNITTQAPQTALFQIRSRCAQPGIKTYCESVLGNYPQDVANQLSSVTSPAITALASHLSAKTSIVKLKHHIKTELTQLRKQTRAATLSQRHRQVLIAELEQMRAWTGLISQLVQAQRIAKQASQDGKDRQQTIDGTCSRPKLSLACEQVLGQHRSQVTNAVALLSESQQGLTEIAAQLQHHWRELDSSALTQRIASLTQQAQTAITTLNTAQHQASLLLRGLTEETQQGQHAMDRRMLVEDYLDTVVQAGEESLQALSSLSNAIPLHDCAQLTDKRRAKHCHARQAVGGYLKQSVALLPSIDTQKQRLRQLRDSLTASSCSAQDCSAGDRIVLQAETAKNMALLKAQVIAGFSAAATRLQSLG